MSVLTLYNEEEDFIGYLKLRHLYRVGEINKKLVKLDIEYMIIILLCVITKYMLVYVEDIRFLDKSELANSIDSCMLASTAAMLMAHVIVHFTMKIQPVADRWREYYNMYFFGNSQSQKGRNILFDL